MLYGVLSHQGAYNLHENVLRKLGKKSLRVFTADDIEKIDTLIIPGGESTTIINFFDRLEIWDVLKQRILDGMPVLGTCAGLILLAKGVRSHKQRSLEVLDVDVERMGYGRQVESFEENLEMPVTGEKSFKGVFIRAPRIVRVGDGVEVIARLHDEPVAVRNGRIWGTTFHPELTNDIRFHREFVRIAESG